MHAHNTICVEDDNLKFKKDQLLCRGFFNVNVTLSVLPDSLY